MTKLKSLHDSCVAILGLGLMGGSLAMAMREKCARLLGFDPNPKILALARQLRVVDQVAEDPKILLSQADLVILAAPVQTIMELLCELPELHSGHAIVLDLGSTKEQIVRIMQVMPERFDPLGGHPMCGKEHATLANADPNLYQDAPFALTPLPRTSLHAKSLARELVLAVGAQPLWLDAETHDRWVAATSHLPYLVANSLAAVTPVQARPLVGPGLRSSIRLAPSDWIMMRDTLVTNRSNIMASLQSFRQHLEIIENLLEANDMQALERLTTQGSQNYSTLIL